MASNVQFGVAPVINDDGRLDAPAFHRNHQPIWTAIAPIIATCGGDVLELGSGTGQHVVTFAQWSPDVTWWPSDLPETHLASINAWRAFTGVANVQPPLRIDLTEVDWFGAGAAMIPAAFGAMFCANVVHIAPWRVAEGLFAGAARYLRPHGKLMMYGPFMRNGQHTATSNAQFDASLRARDPSWGVRDIADLSVLAGRVGLSLQDVLPMPADNFILIFDRSKAD